jgi:L-amino acid N-acyltransferase YncA
LSQIRPAEPQDWPQMRPIFYEVSAGGDTYVFAADTPEADARAYWFGPGISSFVAADDATGVVLGMYKLVTNYRDRGSHVANASFMVSARARGRGIGREMGLAALAEARQRGYQAMQFNFVVSTNTSAVALWQSLGFQIVGTLPKAFQHQQLGLVDAYVMYRFLEP